MKTALTIAGSDSSGGAGIQADLKAMTMNGVFAMSAITALTAQNTTGVQGIFEVTPEFLAQQIDSVFTDIRPDAVKIGMVASSGLIEVIAERLQHYGAKNIVVDPVMVATSGARLISEDAIATLEARLLPLATVLTPNIPEAEVLSGLSITSPDDMIAAGKVISERYGCAVLCKGGHRLNDANDLLYRDGGYAWFNGKRITPTPTAPAARSRARSRQTSPRAMISTQPSAARRRISPARWPPCSTSVRAPVRWTTRLTSSPNTVRRPEDEKNVQLPEQPHLVRRGRVHC